MSDILSTLAAALAKQGAPVLGGMIGTAIGGAPGAAIGGMAGKAIEALATALEVPADPESVNDALAKPGASGAIESAESSATVMLPVWSAQLTIAAQAQTAEIEKGFGSWNARRNFCALYRMGVDCRFRTGDHCGLFPSVA